MKQDPVNAPGQSRTGVKGRWVDPNLMPWQREMPLAEATVPAPVEPTAPATSAPKTNVPAALPGQTASSSTKAVTAERDPSDDSLTVPLKHRALFYRQCATCAEGGISLGATMAHLETAATTAELREAAGKGRLCVERGGKFSKWMTTRPHIFTRAEAALLHAGETSGALDIVFDRIASDLEDQLELKRRLSRATFMFKFVVLPLLLLTADASQFTRHGLDAVANVGSQVSEAQQRGMIFKAGLQGYLHAMGHRVLMVGLTAAVIYIVVRMLLLTPWGRAARDRLTLIVPGIGRLWRDMAIRRLLTALCLMARAGMTGAASLEACRGIAGNKVLDAKIDKAAALARDGNLSAATALAQTNLLRGEVISLMHTGEASGATPDMLDRASSLYDSDVQTRLVTVPKAVGFIVFAVCAVIGLYVMATNYRDIYDARFDAAEKWAE